MEFRTVTPPVRYPFQTGHDTPVLSLGSCFAEHMGKRLAGYKFSVVSNPFGIVFNPLSLAQGIQRLCGTAPFELDDLHRHEGRWLSFAHHGSFTGPQADSLLNHMNSHLEQGRRQLREAGLLLLTLGSAFVWERIDTGEVVANCHKLPTGFFQRRRAALPEIMEALQPALEQAFAYNPALRVLLSVSPVRHLRDGLIDNQRSKATLLLAAAALEQQFDQVFYFPAYELLLDDLRDYRFYGRDLTHPSDLAIDYIWAYFQEALIHPESQKLIPELKRLQLAMAHRPLRPESLEHQEFIELQLKKIASLEKAWPSLNFQPEKEFFMHSRNESKT